MAKPGEIAKIHSQAQYDYFLKQCQSSMPKVDRHHNPKRGADGKPLMRNKPLDSRGQARNASRDEEGNVIEPGGGKADAPPSQNQACQALMAFHRAGGRRSNLPTVSPTKNAARKDAEHAKMRKDQVVRPATRPRGTAEYNKRLRQAMARGESKEYLSKSINEEFNSALDEALGL